MNQRQSGLSLGLALTERKSFPMKNLRLLCLFMLAPLLGLGTSALAGVPEELAAFKTATTELKTCMESITNEATAKANVAKLEAAITKYNQTGATVDASLAKLDRAVQANATVYQNTQAEMQQASAALIDQQVRLLSAPPISAVVSPKLNALRK
jgi:biotin-(acetyl-CoA carboxylase) ligase